MKNKKLSFFEVAEKYSYYPDSYNFKNIIKGGYIDKIGEDTMLTDSISSSKLNELNYVVGERAYIFIKTKQTKEVEPTLEKFKERVKYDLVRKKVEEQMEKFYN